MSDPVSRTTIPHLLGVTLSGGVAKTQVVVRNRTNDDRLIGATDVNSNVIFDAADFTSGYVAGDVIEFENVGASVGKATITVNATGQFQSVTLSAAGAPTVAISL